MFITSCNVSDGFLLHAVGNNAQDDSARRRMETSDSTYDAPERPPAVIVQCQGEIATTTEIA